MDIVFVVFKIKLILECKYKFELSMSVLKFELK